MRLPSGIASPRETPKAPHDHQMAPKIPDYAQQFRVRDIKQPAATCRHFKVILDEAEAPLLRPLMRGLAVAGCAACLAACGGVPPAPMNQGPAEHLIHVISNGWHTGLVLARDDVPPGRIPEAADVPDARYLEFGWGDREYYPSPRPTIGMALGAALTPSPAVIHLAGRDAPPQPSAPGIEVLAVPVRAAGLDRLTAHLDAAFDRPAGGRAASIAPGLYPDSHFYPAHGKFHLFNTCNTWIAHKLAAAGVPLSTDVMTADELMQRLRDALAKTRAYAAGL
jgi:uncharacterized protein (TIGR02117 family)